MRRPKPGANYRFTPTRVGNTSTTCGLTPGFSVHPHTRGEYAIHGMVTGCVFGSPPHAWGIPRRVRARPLPAWFTPTRVGNTSIAALCLAGSIGSPPHAWGIPEVPVPRGLQDRFTPTRVGNTNRPILWSFRTSGSPPHAWGIRKTSRLLHICNPVHPHTRGEYARGAGGRRIASTVHPHTRGEYSCRPFTRPTTTSVHPHTRGEYVAYLAVVRVGLRFTPTRVGNT